MSKEEKRKYEGQVLTEEDFECLEFHEDVERIENNGNSGINPSWVWYTCYLADGTEFDIYG